MKFPGHLDLRSPRSLGVEDNQHMTTIRLVDDQIGNSIVITRHENSTSKISDDDTHGP
jgi:hypothetical protein